MLETYVAQTSPFRFISNLPNNLGFFPLFLTFLGFISQNRIFLGVDLLFPNSECVFGLKKNPNKKKAKRERLKKLGGEKKKK